MINTKLVTKNKKIFIEKEIINLKNLNFEDNTYLIKNILSSCKHGTEKWIISQKAHWIKYKRDKSSNFFTSKVYRNYKDKQYLGNMVIGKILKKCNTAKTFKVGDEVLAYSGSADYSILKSNQIICKISKGVPLENYLCFDPLIFALGALRDSEYKFGDNIGVVGLGAIGMTAVTLLSKNTVADIVAVDLDQKRLKIAKEIGASKTLNPSKKNDIENYRTKVNNIGLDLVFDFSGSVAGLNTAISLCKYNGKVIAGSMYDEANAYLKLGKEFHWNNIKIISSRVVNEPNLDAPAWNKERVFDLAKQIINSKKYDFKKIINKKFPFKDAIKIYKKNIIDNKILKITFFHK